MRHFPAKGWRKAGVPRPPAAPLRRTRGFSSVSIRNPRPVGAYRVLLYVWTTTGNTWQKNTVITLLSRLVDKGMLKTGKIGRRNEYIALVSEADYRSAQARTLVSSFALGLQIVG